MLFISLLFYLLIYIIVFEYVYLEVCAYTLYMIDVWNDQ